MGANVVKTLDMKRVLINFVISIEERCFANLFQSSFTKQYNLSRCVKKEGLRFDVTALVDWNKWEILEIPVISELCVIDRDIECFEKCQRVVLKEDCS